MYQDCALWAKLARGGLVNLKQHFSMESARGPLLRALAEAGLPPPLPFDQVECGIRGGSSGKGLRGRGTARS